MCSFWVLLVCSLFKISGDTSYFLEGFLNFNGDFKFLFHYPFLVFWLTQHPKFVQLQLIHVIIIISFLHS